MLQGNKALKTTQSELDIAASGADCREVEGSYIGPLKSRAHWEGAGLEQKSGWELALRILWFVSGDHVPKISLDLSDLL